MTNTNLLAFILMPFTDSLTKIYKNYIKPTLESLGYVVKRADDMFSPTPILEDILKLIREADILIAELTGRNSNVYYELGRAHEIGKHVILICQNADEIPFDLKHLRSIVYEKNKKGYESLKNDLIRFINNYQVDTLIISKERDFSVTRDIKKELQKKIEDIKSIGRSRINDILSSCEFAEIIRIYEYILDEIDSVEDKGEYKNMFKFLHSAILIRENPNEKIILVRYLIENISKRDIWVKKKILSNLLVYLNNPYIVHFLIESNYIPLFIEIFKESISFEDGGIRSKILLKFKGSLKKSDLEQIVVAFMENDQNKKSYYAQDNISELLDYGLYAVPYRYSSEIKDMMESRKNKKRKNPQ